MVHGGAICGVYLDGIVPAQPHARKLLVGFVEPERGLYNAAAVVSGGKVHGIYLSVDSKQAMSYEPFHAMHVEKLGLKGLFFWKHTGWKDSSE